MPTQQLLALGAKADLVDMVGDTPLHIAAGHPTSLDIIRALVNACANLSPLNNNENTPLDEAYEMREFHEEESSAIIRLLERAGAKCGPGW